jgi:hypothetical protein
MAGVSVSLNRVDAAASLSISVLLSGAVRCTDREESCGEPPRVDNRLDDLRHLLDWRPRWLTVSERWLDWGVGTADEGGIANQQLRG